MPGPRKAVGPSAASRKSAAKSYAQYCPVARALDVLGERWTLLIVRDLAMGPRRYTDLREGLPGIATDLLTARLRTLESAGFVARRELPRPAPAVVYELTDAGRQQLAPVIGALADVGVGLLGPPGASDSFSPERAVLLALRHAFAATGASDLEETYELIIDEEPFSVRVGGAEVDVSRGPAAEPAMTLRTGTSTLLRLLSAEIAVADALKQGSASLDGDHGALERFIAAFSYHSGRFGGAPVGPQGELTPTVLTTPQPP
jgi:DNA-binding HxlR family transcriptional regulator